ncbi:MAG: hypothetical protein IPP47_28090 [Bryobacterales bacterium]|nr:hypothetical protein [Bryobacterales bacterium]
MLPEVYSWPIRKPGDLIGNLPKRPQAGNREAAQDQQANRASHMWMMKQPGQQSFAGD